jgi:hypothetical protein
MTDSIDLPLGNDDRLAEPPLLDSLHYEAEPDGFSIIFVPSMGEDATRSVFVPRDSTEGRRISALLYRIEPLIGDRLQKVVHGGGGDYSLRLAGGKLVRLSDEAPNGHWAPEVFDRLKQIANAAELAFNVLHPIT